MRIAFYTAIYGEYDVLKQPLNRSINVNYDCFIFTDKEIIIEGFETMVLTKYKQKNNSIKARYAKLKAHNYLKDYDYLVWFDASMQIDLNEIVTLIHRNKEIDLFLFKHPTRTCIYKEITACYFAFKEKPIKLFIQNIYYRLAGFKTEQGLYATGVFIRKYKPKVNNFFCQWFRHVYFLSKRDQISLTFVLRKQKLNLLVLNEDIYDSPLATFYGHSKAIYNTNKGVFRRAYSKVKIVLKKMKTR